MKKVISYSLAIAAVAGLTGCNGKMNQFQADYFTTNPNPLEVVGTQVPATVNGNIPAKFFKKNAVVTVTPVLVYASGETASAPVTFQGEKVRGNNPVINYGFGNSISIPVNYTYTPAMQKSELYLTFNVQQGNKTYALPRVKVADGVVATAALADAGTVNPALAPDAFQRIINEKYSAQIRFIINQANIRKNQIDSPEMLSLNEQLRNAAAAKNREIQEINIESYASPDGPLSFNTKLAEKREQNTKGFVNDRLKKDKITEFGELTAQFTPEDWEGFQKLVAASNIQDKELILSILQQTKDPEIRDQRIRDLSNVFEALAEEILPQLRYSKITASIDVIGKSDAEINAAFDTNPASLTVDELLYAATLTDNNNRKQAIYEAVTKYYPNDYRGYNDLGLAQYVNKDYKSALKNFNKAAQLAPNATEPKMNQGLISLLNKDYNAANRSFGSAAGQQGLGDALGVYYLTQGDNAAAVKAFGNSKTNNAALAQILTKDYSAAKNTLAAVANPNATTYYLTAVLGARTNNTAMAASNLKKAIALDPSLATNALNDLEFSKIDVKSLVK